MGDLAMEEDRPILPSFAAPLSNPDPSSIRVETWVAVDDPVREVLNCIHPTLDTDEKRKDVIEYVQKLIRYSVGLEVFPYGSVPLKTYLPDGDIDLTVLCTPNFEDVLPREVLRVLQEEEQRGNTDFVLKDTQFIDAEVKLVKCLVQDIVIDISFNQLGGLCTLCFLEQVDRVAGKDHLFKRSIILIKAWCYYESRILGAHHGLISTYALETLVLYIFHVFHESLTSPAEVLYKFLDYYSKFDWDKNCVSLDGPVSKSSLPNLTVENPDNEEGEVLLSGEFRKNCMDMFILPSRGLESDLRGFTLKHLNIIDPLKENNNLGRSVHKGNYFRIRSAFRYGARKLGRILQLPSNNIRDEIQKFFKNTLQRHKPKYGSEAALQGYQIVPFVDDDSYSKVSNGEYDEYEPNNTHYSSLNSSPRSTHLGAGAGNGNDVNALQNLGSWMEIGQPKVVDGDTICLSDKNNDNASDNSSTEETDNLDPFADLRGDYDAHIRNLLYGQSVHGYSMSASVVHVSSPMSPYDNNHINPWDPSVAWSVSQVNTNGMIMGGGQPMYLNSPNRNTPSAAARGTGTYIPVMGCKEKPRGRGRGRGGSNGRGCGGAGAGASGSGENRLVVEVNHIGQGQNEQSPRQGRGVPDISNQNQPPNQVSSVVNAPRKLEFGAFRSSPENLCSPSYVQSPRDAYGKKQGGRNGESSLSLKNEEEFPPLSV